MASPARVQIVCFSMDRVFQLSEYLRTLHEHVLFHGVRLGDDPSWARIAIVAKCSTPAIRSYYDAIAALYGHVQFLYEDPDEPDGAGDFAARFLESVQYGDDNDAVCDLVVFNVDDAFYYEDVELAKAQAFLTACPHSDASTTPWHFAFHLKLAPSIWRSHLTNQSMLPLPPMTTVLPAATKPTALALSSEAARSIYLTFDPARGSLDWGYPWELSGSVYTRATVVRVLDAIQAQFGRDGISRPNFLELRGHEIVTTQWMGKTHTIKCACLPRPKMHVFAINQVQDIFDNRLYSAEPILTAASSRSPSSRELRNLLERDNATAPNSQNDGLTQLLHLFESNETLDEGYYRRQRFSSVHIGTLVLAGAMNSQPRARGSVDWTADHTPLCSVVMPVYNAEAYVDDALRSVLQQTYSQMEIIIIDDASTDDSSRIIAERMAGDSRVKYIRNESNMGISASLNKGFSLAQGTFVARMDADDISFPDRIQRQIHFMLEHPFVDILGTSILVGRDDEGAEDASPWIETACYPTSPLATRWQLLFGCFVAHPTVMMHRRVLNTIVAASTSHELYSTSQPACEDYDLWLRCAYGHELTIMSLGDVLLFHRKHSGNTDSARRSEQLQQTQTTAIEWFQQLLDHDIEVDAAAIQPLLNHEGNYTVDQLQRAIALLKRLEAKFVIPTKRDISRTSSPSISPQEQEMRQDEWAAEQQYVHNDAASRHGELAFHAMLVDPTVGAALWSEFANEHPEMSRAAFEKLMTRKNSSA